MRKFTLLFSLVAMLAISNQSFAQDHWCWTCNPATNGYVRIGTNAPYTTKQLYVQANNTDHVGVFSNIDQFGNGLIVTAASDPLRVGGYNNFNGNLLRVQTNGITSIGHATPPTTNLWRLNVNGSAISSGWFTSSDKRLKKEIHEDFESYSGLYQVKTYDYKYKDDSEGTLQFGVMAQEVKDIYPNLVAGDENNGYAVNYTAMIPLLIRAVQDQKQTIESLQEELTELKTKITENDELAELIGIEGERMTIFPNPSSNIANITLQGNTRGNVSLEVVNLNGEVVKRVANNGSKSAEINTADMLKGVYFVRYIRDGKVVETKRLLIQK